MNYTVVGLFPNAEMANAASNRLDSAGFAKEDYNVSGYRTEGAVDASDDYEYDEDQDTRGFWDKLFGSDETDRKAYSYAGTRSNLVTVYTDSAERAEKAREIMDEAGATSVDDHLPESYHRNNPDYRQKYAVAGTTEQKNVANDAENIQVIKEDINVGKKEVADGGIRIKSRIVETPVEESVRLKNERVYIKRNPVNKVVGDAAFQDQTIEMTQTKEVPVVDKTTRVVEEISLGKDVDVNEEKITDTVRETKVDIEDNRGNKIDENRL